MWKRELLIEVVGCRLLSGEEGGGKDFILGRGGLSSGSNEVLVRAPSEGFEFTELPRFESEGYKLLDRK